MAYDLGDLVPLTVEIRDAAGALTAATGVVLTVTLPDGTTETPSVTTPSTGRYQCDYAPAAAGRYVARWTASNPQAAWVDEFDIRPATPGYVLGLADAKAYLNITSSTVDAEMQTFLEATTEVVEQLSGRVLARRVVTERRALRGARSFGLSYTPVLGPLTSIVDLDHLLTWSVTDFTVDGDTGVVDVALTAVPPCGRVSLTYTAGYEAIPARYTQAAKVILRHLWESQRASIGGAGRTRFGDLADGQVVVAGYSIPRAAAELVGSTVPGIA